MGYRSERNEMNNVDIYMDDISTYDNHDVESVAITNYHQMVDVDDKNDDDASDDYTYHHHNDNNTAMTKPNIKLFMWIDHFIYIFVIPCILLFHFCNIELDLCRISGMHGFYDISILSSSSSFMCTTITVNNNTMHYNCFLLSSIGFFIISIYLYTISLYQIAPWMFMYFSWYNTNDSSIQPNPIPGFMSSILYQIIFILPEIVFIAMIGCITMKYIEESIRLMLLATISFSWFTIIVMGRQIFYQ
jgi:hypothetical protein